MRLIRVPVDLWMEFKTLGLGLDFTTSSRPTIVLGMVMLRWKGRGSILSLLPLSCPVDNFSPSEDMFFLTPPATAAGVRVACAGVCCSWAASFSPSTCALSCATEISTGAMLTAADGGVGLDAALGSFAFSLSPSALPFLP